jgi:hypothetical protein
MALADEYLIAGRLSDEQHLALVTR